MSKNFKDYYRILGVTSDASLQNIRAAADREYRANSIYPSVVAEIREAYNVLSDYEKRREYDEKRQKNLSKTRLALSSATDYESYMNLREEIKEEANRKRRETIAKKQAEREQAEREQAEREQAEREQAEREQAEREQAEREQAERAQAEREQAEREQAERAQAERDQAEREQAERAQAEREQAERAQAEREQAEREQAEREQAEREQAEREQAEREQAEREQAERAQAEREQAEREQAEREQAERAQAEREQAERAQAEREQAERAQAASESVPKNQSQVGTDSKKGAQNKSATTSPISSPTENKSKYSSSGEKLMKFTIDTAAIFGGTAIAGIPGLLIGVTVAIISNEIIDKTRKFRLVKTEKENKITQVDTPETKLIDEANKKLDAQIKELLSKPNSAINNYELEIAKLKYANQQELLKKRIEFKRNEAVRKGMGIKQKLELHALCLQAKKADKKLELLNSYMPDPEVKDKLTRLDEKIEEVTTSLQDENISEYKKNNLSIRLGRLNHKRLSLANRMSLNRNEICRKQLLLASIIREPQYYGEEESEEFIESENKSRGSR